MSAEETLAQVAQEVAQCTRCELHRTRKQAVPGEGPANTEIMLIGEGPGFHENEQGRPFVGAAGNFLEELLAQAGLKRSDVWIGNVVKCRPPGNRDPLPEELCFCDDYLERQIRAINPRSLSRLGVSQWLNSCQAPRSVRNMDRCARLAIALSFPCIIRRRLCTNPNGGHRS